MCGLRTHPQTDVDPPRFLDGTAIGGGGISSRRPRGDTLLTLLAQCAEQGLCNGRVSVCLSVRRYRSTAAGTQQRRCRRSTAQQHGGQQQMRAVSHLQPPQEAEHFLDTLRSLGYNTVTYLFIFKMQA